MDDKRSISYEHLELAFMDRTHIHTHTQRMGNNVKDRASGAVLAVLGVYSPHLRTEVFVYIPALAPHNEISFQ